MNGACRRRLALHCLCYEGRLCMVASRWWCNLQQAHHTNLLKQHPQQAGIQGNFNPNAAITNQELPYICRTMISTLTMSMLNPFLCPCYHPTFVTNKLLTMGLQEKRASFMLTQHRPWMPAQTQDTVEAKLSTYLLWKWVVCPMCEGTGSWSWNSGGGCTPQHRSGGWCA